MKWQDSLERQSAFVGATVLLALLSPAGGAPARPAKGAAHPAARVAGSRTGRHQPLTPEEGRRLAVGVLLQAWREAEQSRYPDRQRILVALARAEPGRAEALFDQDHNWPQQERSWVRSAMLRAAVDADPERALPLLARADTPLSILLEAAERLASREPNVATALLDRVLVAKEPWKQSSPVLAAWLARELRHPRALELAGEAVQWARSQVPDAGAPEATLQDQPRVSAQIAASVGVLDVDEALRLLARVPDAVLHQHYKLVMATQIARRDPVRALSLVNSEPWEHPRGGYLGMKLSAAVDVAGALASRDPAAAEALARSVPMRGYRLRALAAVALGLPPERATALRSEVVREGAAAPLDVGYRGMAYLALSLPPGPERAAICARMLSLQGGGYSRWRQSNRVRLRVMAVTALLLAGSDAEASRQILEDAEALCRRCEMPPVPRERIVDAQGYGQIDPFPREPALYDTAIAWVALGPERAVALARRIPPADAEGRFGALTVVAGYLLAAPNAREQMGGMLLDIVN